MNEENKEIVENNINASGEKETTPISLTSYLSMMMLFLALIVVAMLCIVQIIKDFI